MITTGDRAIIVKGNRARGLNKGVTLLLTGVTPLGPEYGHSVKVTFITTNGPHAGRAFAFYARHINRMSDPLVNLNDGNPFHKITVKAAS